MPAKKPASLSQRHDTKADRAARADAESAVRPRTVLSADPPAALHGRALASSTWRRLLELQAETKAAQDGAPLITAFDADLLIKYCVLEEELVELAKLRALIQKEYESQLKTVQKMKPDKDTQKDYLHLWDVVNALFARFQGVDARLDGKRKLQVSIAQSMYLTPRARAGVPINEAPPTAPESAMEKHLNGKKK